MIDSQFMPPKSNLSTKPRKVCKNRKMKLEKETKTSNHLQDKNLHKFVCLFLLSDGRPRYYFPYFEEKKNNLKFIHIEYLRGREKCATENYNGNETQNRLNIYRGFVYEHFKKAKAKKKSYAC